MFDVKPEPCQNCPYRKDVPSGVWHYDEYEKLRGYDDNSLTSMFVCHKTNVSHRIPLSLEQPKPILAVCKGWLMVHRDSVAARLAQACGKIDGKTCFTETKAELHESGNAAADFGQRDIEKPSRKALDLIEKMNKTGKFKT